MKTLPLSEVKTNLSKLVEAVSSRDEQVLITRNGRPAAMLVSPDEIEGWRETVEIMSDPEAMAEIRKNRAALKAGRGKIYSDRELRKLFGLDEDRPRRRRAGR